MVDLPIAPPRDGEARVRVHAVSLNPIDWKVRRGTMKWMSGSKFPMRVGGDLAGVVESVGPNVTSVRVGDRVFGFAEMNAGTFADAFVIKASRLVKLESNVSFETAAAALVMVTALQGVRDAGRIGAGMRVLITGATGGVGIPAVQLAKAAGARVTATGSAKAVELARELGAEESFDYRAVDIVARGGEYDVILDFAGTMRFAQGRTILSRRGVLIDPVPTPARLIGQTVANLFRGQKWRALLTKPKVDDLVETARALAEGGIRIVVDRSFPSSQVVDAYRYAEQGGVVGKVVVRFAE